jgi:hypothetical protein
MGGFIPTGGRVRLGRHSLLLRAGAGKAGGDLQQSEGERDAADEDHADEKYPLA